MYGIYDKELLPKDPLQQKECNHRNCTAILNKRKSESLGLMLAPCTAHSHLGFPCECVYSVDISSRYSKLQQNAKYVCGLFSTMVLILLAMGLCDLALLFIAVIAVIMNFILHSIPSYQILWTCITNPTRRNPQSPSELCMESGFSFYSDLPLVGQYDARWQTMLPNNVWDMPLPCS